jgi:acyl carrier protein
VQSLHERNNGLWRAVNTLWRLPPGIGVRQVGARDALAPSAADRGIDNASHGSILTAAFLWSERHVRAGVSTRIRAFHEFIPMSDSNARSVEERIAGVVQRLLREHSIDHTVGVDEDLRQAGLSSLDMVTLVLSVEEEFDLMVPEVSIMPTNFRSIAAISRLVDSLRGQG